MKIKLKACLTKQPVFLLNGEVIWQVSDSPLSKELHGCIHVNNGLMFLY